MTDLQNALDQIKAREEKATEGPWSWECALTLEGSHEVFEVLSGGSSDFVSVASGGEDSDGEFIAHARTDVPRLVEAVEAVRKYVEIQRQKPARSTYGKGYDAALEDVMKTINEHLGGAGDEQ